MENTNESDRLLQLPDNSSWRRYLNKSEKYHFIHSYLFIEPIRIHHFTMQ